MSLWTVINYYGLWRVVVECDGLWTVLDWSVVCDELLWIEMDCGIRSNGGNKIQIPFGELRLSPACAAPNRVVNQ